MAPVMIITEAIILKKTRFSFFSFFSSALTFSIKTFMSTFEFLISGSKRSLSNVNCSSVLDIIRSVDILIVNHVLRIITMYDSFNLSFNLNRHAQNECSRLDCFKIFLIKWFYKQISWIFYFSNFNK